MEWTNELTLEFLQLFENEPVIWNPKIPEHKNRNKVADAWNNIKTSFSVECSITELKKKKDSLMALFRQSLNKVKASLKSGAGRDDVYRPTWFAYETMANFLQPVYFPRNTINTEADDEEEASNNNDQQELEQVKLVSPQPPVSKAKRSRPMEMSVEAIEGHLKEAANVMQKVTNKPHKDDCSLYDELLASRLRALDEFNRDLLMHAIDNLVFETTMKIKRGNSSIPSRPSIFEQYHQAPVGLSHPQHSPSISISSPNYTPQMSPASSTGSRTASAQPSPSIRLHSQNYSLQPSPSTSIYSQNDTPQPSPSPSVYSQYDTPPLSASMNIHSQKFSFQPSSHNTALSSMEDDDENDVQYHTMV